MRCSKCGTESTSGKKFCPECGSPLPHRCAKCGADNSPTAKFCEDCGAALETPAVASSEKSNEAPIRAIDAPDSENLAGERKTVTALFADIKGSTELEQDLDPEEARAIVDPALKLMIDAVRRYDGYIVQSTGDGIFALFGAPVAHEDHPQRALYAALRMHEEIRRYADRLRADGRAPIQIRVGANTGEVVVRSIATGAGHAEYTPIGHTANLASRMQTLANPGSTVITESTRRMAEGFFTLKPLGESRVKGIQQPVAVYELTGRGPLRTRLQRAAGRGLSRFVGREREIEALTRAAQLAKAGRGQIVAAIGEAGVGKSRLFYEFKAKNQSDWMVLEAFSVSHGKASVFLPVIDLLHAYFGIEPGDDPRRRREKVNGRVLTLDRALEDTLPYLFALLGLVGGDDPLAAMDARIRRRRTLDALKRILLRESLNQPLILVFEDLHWIDEETQAFLDLIADSITGSRVLTLVNYRPEYSHTWTETYCTQLRLEPLGRESAERLLAALLGDDLSLLPLRRLIVEKTEGNPFFIEEIVQALFEDGSLVRDGTTRLTRTTDALRVPPTVQGILASRIDRLSAPEKDLLQTLAVIGKDFPLPLVRAVWQTSPAPGAPAQGEDRLLSMLDDLQLAEFIYEQPAAGDAEYTFKHALTQEVTYKSMLQERRRLLHERIGSAIEAVFSDKLDDHLGDLAYHYGRGRGGAKAIDYLWRAADQRFQRSLYSDAIAHLERGLELAAALPTAEARARDELRLRMMLGAASMAARGFSSEEVLQSFSRSCELARSLEDADQLFFALAGMWGFHYARGEVQPARRIAEESMVAARRVDDAALLKYAHYTSGASLQVAGDLIRAREHLESALALGDPPGLGQGPVQFGSNSNVLCLTTLSDVLFGLGYPDQSLSRGHDAMRAVKRESDPFSFAMAMISVVQAHCARREGRSGEQLSRELIKLCSEHGFPYWLAGANRCLSWAIVLQGRFDEGIAMMNQHIAEAGESGIDAEIALFNLLPLMAEAYGSAGLAERGLAALDRWREMHSQRPLPNMEKMFWRIRGQLISEAGSADEAEKCLRKAIEMSAVQQARLEQLRSTTALARVLRAQNRGEEARAMLAEIYGWFTEGFDTADLNDAKALLDSLA